MKKMLIKYLKYYFYSSKSICDPTLNEELATILTNPENSPLKELLFKMIQDEEYDLALSFTTGGSDVM